MKNQFEHAARAAKVAKLLAHVPVAETPDQVAPIAVYCMGLSHAHRAELARQAGTLFPSPETWRHLIAAIWARGSRLQERRSA